ncbi:short-chain dehydrogenase/reductase [Streptacidiphilus pinicola]|uniref:Short-chain dehydrogenase/reductase n=1 Tax=Streptacidiphilus pinicola TaxID=2219663 RepID=A0A2X0IRI2_9ACTN|nr:SDR family NAD(P)-dependent oxidoreductase [Streptacidiphilus pinicola]RAG87217.1 short-chain dehydrogenase/reductase [Streptacidiphilus pinicola]
MSKTWFITGTSRGFGRAWTEAALARGDKVAATARNTDSLKDLAERYGDALLLLALDVTDRASAFAAVQEAHRHFGRVDVVVNNAGYGHFGFIEELTEQEVRAQLETNLFGALWVTQAAIPLLREQGSGHFLQVSSVGGVAAFPGLGAYHASKWGLEGFSDALLQELAPFGIKVTLIEPGGYATDWGGDSASHSEPNPVYQPQRDAIAAHFSSVPQPGPEVTVPAVFAAVDAAEPPLRLPLSGFAYEIVTEVYRQRLQAWKRWEAVSYSADGT